MNNEKGFSLVELLITMAVFVVVIAASTRIFVGLLTQFKQQSTISETNISGNIGLEILRRDLLQAGIGLPWDLDGAAYTEAVNDNASQTYWVDRNLNDSSDKGNIPGRGCNPGCTEPGGTSHPPGAIRSLNGDCNDPVNLGDPNAPGIHNGATKSKMPNTCADVLAIKSSTVAMSAASQKWSYIANKGMANDMLDWGTSSNVIDDNDYVVVLQEGSGKDRKLLRVGGSYYTKFGNSAAYAPKLFSYGVNIIYDVGDATAPRMPFNRADYYVKRPDNGMPGRCAPKTGILYKAMLNNNLLANGGYHTEMPLLDCVIDFQVEYVLDQAAKDAIGAAAYANCGKNPIPPPTDPQIVCDDISNLTAADIRTWLKEVIVYIVAQEGRRDTSYDFSSGGARQAITANQQIDPNYSRTLTFVNLKNAVGAPEYTYYRWKLYTMTVKPDNLGRLMQAE